MSQTNPHFVRTLEPMRVKYRDVFHLRNLYITMHEYLQQRGWLGLGSGDPPWEPHSDIEAFYLEKVDQKAIHVGGKEMWIWWRLTKNYEGKSSSYVRNRLDIDFRTAYLKDVEVVHQNKKVKVQQGEVEIFIRAGIETDFNGEWENHWLLKHLQTIYEKRILHQEFEKREKELWREVYKLQAEIKDFLKLRQFIPTPTPFHPSIYGWEG